MRKFDSIKRDLFGDETATLDPDYTQVPSDPKATSLTNRLLEAKARLNQQKLQVATEVFGNGHKNTSGVAAQKAYIQSPDNTEIPDTPSQEPALALDVNDFEDGEITEQDRNTPGAIADKVAKKAQEPVAPVNMPEEWDSLLSSIAKTEDLVLLGLDKGAESLEVAAKEFMTAKGATGLNSQQATQYLNNNVKDLIDWIKDNPPKTEETVMDKLSRAGDQFVQGISKAGDTLFDADKWTAATDAFFEGVSKAPDAFKSGVKKTLQQLNLPASEAELEVALKSFAEKYPNLMWIDESPDSIDTANKNEEAVKKFVAEYGKTLGISIEEPTEAPTKPPVVTDISSKQTIKTKERLLDAINIAEGKKDARIPYGYFSEAFEKRLAAGETISPEEARTEVSKHIDRHIKMWEAGGSRSDVAGAQERGLINANPEKNSAIKDGNFTSEFLKWYSEIYAPVNAHPLNKNWLTNISTNLDIQPSDEFITVGTPEPTKKPVRRFIEEPIVDETKPPPLLPSTPARRQGNYDLDYTATVLGPSASADALLGSSSLDPMSLLATDPNIEKAIKKETELAPLESTSPVIETYGNATKHKDGTWSVRTREGVPISGLPEVIAKSYHDYNKANWEADPNAPADGSFGEYFNRTMQGIRYPAELLASAFATTPEGRANIKEMAESYSKYFPVNRKHMAGAATALQLIAEKEGTGDALLYAFDNVGIFLEEGFDSIGFTLALAFGNIPVQIGMLASLSIGKAKTMKDQWIKDNPNQELTPEIEARIEISAAFSLALEKASISYMKGILTGKPLVKNPIEWMNKVGDSINRGLKSTVTGKAADLLLVKPVTKLALPQVAEGVQELGSELAERAGMTGEVLSYEEGLSTTIRGTLAGPTIQATVGAGVVTKKLTEAGVNRATRTKRRRQEAQNGLDQINAQLDRVTAEERINDLDRQITDLSVEVKEIPGGIESDNVRFGQIYDDLRAKEFKHKDAIVEAKAILAKELAHLKKQKDQLVKDSGETIKLKDNDFLSLGIRQKIAQTDQLIKAAEEAETKDPDKIEKLKNDKKALEDKLETKLNSKQLKFLRTKLVEERSKVEKVLETDLKDDEKTAAILQGKGTKLAEGELPILLDEVAIIAADVDPGLAPLESGEEVAIDVADDYVPDDDSGLERVQETEDGKVISNIIKLKEEPKEWTNDEGRRLTQEDFDSPTEYQKYLNETRQFDANRQKGMQKLDELRKAEFAKLTPEEVNPLRQELLLNKLNEIANRDLNDEEKIVVRKKIDELTKKGVLDSEGTVTKTVTDKLFSGPEAFSDSQTADPKKLKELIETETDPDTKAYLKAVLKAQEDKKKLENKRKDKDFADVHGEVVQGEDKRFKGLHAYRDQIIDLFRNPDKKAPKLLQQEIGTVFAAMQTHATNLTNKLAAFQEAYKNSQSGTLGKDEVWTVAGDKESGNSRKMNYTVAKMSKKAYEAERQKRKEVDEGISFIWEISPQKSGRLIRVLEDEVELGKSALTAVESFDKSSIAKNLDRRAYKQKKDKEFVEGLSQIKDKIKAPVEEITDEAIEDIADPKAKKKEAPKGKTIQDEITELEAEYQKILDEEKAETDKGDIVRSTPDERDKRKQEILDRIAYLKNLDKQPVESDEVPPETTEATEPSPDSAEQPTQETGTDAETETKTKAGKIQDFITSSVKKYWPIVTAALAGSKEKTLGLLNALFIDLVQVGKDLDTPGLHTLEDTAFTWTQEDVDSGKHSNITVGEFSVIKLKKSLRGLGLSKNSANYIANGYANFKKRYNKIAFNKLEVGRSVRIIDAEDPNKLYKIESITDGKATLKGMAEPVPVERLIERSYALREPLSLLLRTDEKDPANSIGVLPDQVLLGMFIGVLSFKTRSSTNTRFTSEWEKKQFLVSGKRDLTHDEERELKGLGLSFNDTADGIGRDVASLLQLSAKKIALDDPTLTQEGADLYYKNLIPALGMMALDIAAGTDSGASFTIENKIWNFDQAKKDDRNYNNTDDKTSYRYLLFPETKNKKVPQVSKEGKESLEELTDKLEIEFEEYGEVLQKPVDTTNRIKTAFKKVPRKVLKALKKLHNAKWTTAESMDSVVALAGGNRAVLEQLMGVIPIEGVELHQRQRDSAEAANRDKNNDLDHLLEANEEGLLQEFYFSYRLQNQHRVMQQGRINPQNSKVSRHLLRSWEPQTYSKENLWKFKLAVAQNFGLDIDKNKLSYAETEFDYIINDGHVQDAVKALQQLKQNKNNKEAANKLAEALSAIKNKERYEEASIGLISAITALANYMPNGDGIGVAEFKSDIAMEIDGITNGFAMNLMQFPMFEDADDLETHLNQVGNYFNVNAQHDPTKPDVYMTLIGHIKTGATSNKALKWYEDTAWKDGFVHEKGVNYHTPKRGEKLSERQKKENREELEKYRKLYNSRDAALKSLDPAMYSYTKEMRKTVKYPFMIFMYGGGTESISRGVASDVVDGIYEQVSALHTEYQEMLTNIDNIIKDEGPLAEREAQRILGEMDMRIDEFLESLEKLGAFEGKTTIKGKDGREISPKERYKNLLIDGKALDVRNGKALYNFNDAELTKVIGRTLEPRFSYGLDSMLGKTRDSRNSLIKMGQMLHRMFMLRYERAYKDKVDQLNEEYKAKLSDEDKLKFKPINRLTDQQVRQMVTQVGEELSEVLPQVAGPLSQILKDKDGNEYTDGALDLSEIRTAREKNISLGLDSDKIENKLLVDGEKFNRAIMAKQLEFIEPGVSALIRQIQNMDSVVLTQTFNVDANVLPLHDAFMASPEQLSSISDVYGKMYLKYNKQFSIMENTFKQLEKVKATLTAQEIARLNKQYLDEESKTDKKDPKNADRFIIGFRSEVANVKEQRDALFERDMVSHQLYMPKPEGDPIEESVRKQAEQEIRNKINDEEPLPGSEADRPVLFGDNKANDDQWRAMHKMKQWWNKTKATAEELAEKRKPEVKEENRIFVLQGRGGTGKTTIVEKAVTDLGIELGEVKFALPTHKAKRVIKQSAKKYGPQDFDTIAGFLGEVPKPRQNSKGEWYHSFERDPLAAVKQQEKLAGVKLIVIDEASMVNEQHTAGLILLARKQKIRLLFMGDNVQLPPIEKDRPNEEGLLVGKVDVSKVFDTVMEIGQKKPLLDIDTKQHYAKLNQRMRQDAGNPILGITDILANIAERIHETHETYLKTWSSKALSFVLPIINNDNVEYMEGTLKDGATDATIKAFTNEYKAARDADKKLREQAEKATDPLQKRVLLNQAVNEQNIKFIHYNNAEHSRSKKLREKIRSELFDDFFAGDVETKPFLVGERIVIDESAVEIKGSMIKRSEDLNNGDEVTVVEELKEQKNTSFKDGYGDEAPTYSRITVSVLKVKTDSGKEHTLVLEHKDSKQHIIDRMKERGTYRKTQEERMALEMFTEGLGAAYLINAHKAQGSTYDTVYVDYENIMRSAQDDIRKIDPRTGKLKRWGPDFLTRVKALYVATSRPRNRLVLVGTDDIQFGTGEQLAENKLLTKNLENINDPLIQDAIDDEIGKKLKSIDDLPKDPTSERKELGDITEGNFRKLFNKFKEFSNQYYASAQEMLRHTETLDSVLDILGEGITEIGGIRLTTQEINGITQGEYDIANQSMQVMLSNQSPFNVNQSPQEVYVHELLHATTALAIRDNPLIANRVDRVYLQTKRALDAKYGKGSGYKVFLAGITNPSANDKAMAKKQYNYVFAGREKNRIHEFLAYAATNRQMIEFLKTQPKAVREGILDEILFIVTEIMNFLKQAFGARTYKAKGDNAFAEILAATEHLVATQAKYESKLALLNTKTYNQLDKADEFFKQLGEDIAVKIAGKTGEPKSMLRAAATMGSGTLFNIFATNEGTIRARQMIDGALNKTMRGIANEIGDGALTKEMIEQLLHVKVNISKARQQAETFTMNWFNGNKDEGIEGIWKSVKEGDKHGLTNDTKVALTRVLFQADLSALLNEGTEWEMSPAEIMDLIGDNRKGRRNTLKAQIAKELRLSHKSPALSYAKELGYWIATGNRKLDDAFTNAASIATDHMEAPTEEQIRLLDMYSTLSALDYTDSSHNRAVVELARKEFAADPDRNGISDLLKSHRTYKNNVLTENFEGNELQIVKGFIVERVDNFTSIRMDRADKVKEMKQLGFSESYPVKKVVPGQTIDTMYVTRTNPEVTDVSGVMSTTNQRNMGTTLTEILVRDPKFHHTKGPNKGKPNFYIIQAEVAKFVKAKNKSAKANTTFKWKNEATMTPLRDAQNNIVDYRVMMNHSDVEQILRPDLQIDHVFAHMRSSAIDRRETIESDKRTVELLVYEQLDLMGTNPQLEWIDIMDPDSPYIDRYRKLPEAVRNHIKQYAKNGRFFIREDIIDKVFGYKSFDLSELKMLQDESTTTKRISKRVAGITHHAIKQTVGYGKNRVVIAMPKVVVGNMMSNIYQLMMRKIPLDYIFHKIFEGVHEYNKYRKDTERRVKLKHEIDSQKLDKNTSPEAIEVAELDDRIQGNLIHRLSKAGLNSLIVEDINDAQADGWLNKLQKTIPYSFPQAQKYIDKIPSELGDAARFIFMTKGSKPYQISRHIVQMTDFLARYVMIEHGTKVQGRDFNEVMHESLDAFVVFDEALVPALETLEAVGATSFLSYYLRNARASRKLAASSPTSVALSAAIQGATGIPTLGNVNSSWLAGKFTPNLLQTDDLFDEANNVTLFDILKNEGRDLFN